MREALVDYNISPLHQAEADIRLADAMLFAALKSRLGEKIEPFSSVQSHKGYRHLWGPDPYRGETVGIRLRQSAYRDPEVLAALGGGTFLNRHQVQAEMDRLSDLGMGSAIRNMRDPCEYKRFLAPGSVFAGSNMSHVRADRYPDEILVHPHLGAEFERRFLVVAGEIAAESPVCFCEEDPALLLDPANRMREAKLPWRDLEEADEDRVLALRHAAEDLLSRFPLTSGAIDIGMARDPDGTVRPQVVEVTAARPGDVYIMFADPVAYAERIAEHLHVLVPDLDSEAEIEP